MKIKNKKQTKQLFFKRTAFLCVVIFLAGFNLSRADLGEYNIFQDKDQDGLSDKEEVSYGTDPEEEDSDGDGYSDKVEIESGYDPLKAAPGDKIVLERELQEINEENGDELETEIDVNLTEEFFKEIQLEESGEAALLNRFIETGKLSQDDVDELYSNENEGEINSIVKDLVNENLFIDIKEKISTENIIILPTPEGEEDEIKKEEKKQIEEYSSALLYILAANRPFTLNNIDSLPEKMSSYLYGISNDIQSGDIEDIQKNKEIIKETFNQISKLEVPEILLENHISLLAVYQTLYNGIDESVLLSDNDPIALLVYMGRIQESFFELEMIQQNFSEIFEEYDIDSFELSSILEEDE